MTIMKVVLHNIGHTTLFSNLMFHYGRILFLADDYVIQITILARCSIWCFHNKSGAL